MKSTSTSVFQTHAEIVGNVLMGPIDTSACVPMASLGSTVKPTLMNACQRLVFMGGTHSSPSFKTERVQMQRQDCMELFLITLLASAVSGDICHTL